MQRRKLMSNYMVIICFYHPMEHTSQRDRLPKIVGLFGLCYFSSLWIALLVADGSLGAGVGASGITDNAFST